MLTKDMDASEKLAIGWKMYSEARGHWNDAKDRMDEAFAFAHGHQWHSSDLKILEEEGRPALTFNLVLQKVQQAVGMNEDNKRSVIAAAVGANDRPLAEVLNALMRHFYLQAHVDEVDSECYEHGIIAGEGATHVSFERDPERPLWAKLMVSVVNPKEVYWDPASRARNRLDARYVIWPRWVSQEEFLAEYPDMKEKVNELFDENGHVSHMHWDEHRSDYYDPKYSDIVDVRRNRLCVLHMEYRSPVEKHFITDGKELREIESDHREAMQNVLAARPKNGTEVMSAWSEKVYWLEVIGNDVLFDGESPEPFDGFSLVPWTCYLDPRSGYTAGLVRALTDPQKDVNKAYSQSLDHLNAQAKPGWIAEKGAVPDVTEFERRNRQAGSVAVVEDDALAGARIQPRTVPVYSPAAATRLDKSMEMLDRVSGIATDPESPARAVEAATTQLLREKKAIRSMRGVLARFQRGQREVGRRVLEGISRIVPDEQILAILSDSQRYQQMPPHQGVEEPHIMDMQLQMPISLRNVRQLKSDIDLDPASESDMQRAIQLEVLVQLHAGQIPIDPEVMIELASSSRSMRERLIAYFKKMQEMNNQMVMQEKQANLQNAAKTSQANLVLSQAEATKAQAEAGNVLLEAERKRQADAASILIDLLTLWEKADSNEKRVLEQRMRGVSGQATPSRV